MRRALILALLIIGSVRAAEALTIQDIIELSRAGLGDDVLLALIEVDRGVYAIDPATLRRLKEGGVSERVIVALIRSGRELPVPDPQPVVLPEEEVTTAPQVVVIEHHAADSAREVLVPVPVYVPVPVGQPRIRRVDRVDHSTVETTYVPFQSGLPAERPAAHPVRSAPVYWGFGGKLRPDAWEPAGHRGTSRRSDDKPHETDRK